MTSTITEFAGKHDFLDNGYPVDIPLPAGHVWPSVEHAYQASKFQEPAIRKKLSEAARPETARLQARLWPVSTPDWPAVRLHVMRTLLMRKFDDPDLSERLVATGKAEIVAVNRRNDRYWGVFEGKGENHLGRLLMEVRQSRGGHGAPVAAGSFEPDTDDYLDPGIDFEASGPPEDSMADEIQDFDLGDGL